MKVLFLHESGTNEEVAVPPGQIKFMRRDTRGARVYIGTNPQDHLVVRETIEQICGQDEPKRKKAPASAWQKFWSSWRKQNGSEGDTQT